MRMLVAGGAGFIGSHLCERLLDEGHEVLCVDSLITGSEDNIQHLRNRFGFTFIERDISSQPLGYLVDGIFHLASPASPIGYWKYPFETIEANTTGTKNLLELAKRMKCRLVYTSTSEAYGDPLVSPQSETYFGNVNPVGPRAVYDESKRLGETLVVEYHRRYGVDGRIARLFNTYGPRNQLDDGRIVPSFIRSALLHQPLTIQGNGHQTRSLSYVDDTIDGLLKLFFTPELGGEVVNIGNPDERKVNHWAWLINYLAGNDQLQVVHEEQRENDPLQRCPDIAKAKRLLDWSPRTVPEIGLLQTIQWGRKVLGLSEPTLLSPTTDYYPSSQSIALQPVGS
jgi:nucleoside-diphosphate-sugar epimerase